MNIVALIILIVGIVLIIRFLGSIIIKLIGILVILGILAYLFLDYNPLEKESKHPKNKLLLIERLDIKYCKRNVNPIICECIVQPIMKDLKAKYPKERIFELRNNRLKSTKEIAIAINNHKDDIQQCLKEKDAGHLWNEFLEELKIEE